MLDGPDSYRDTKRKALGLFMHVVGIRIYSSGAEYHLRYNLLNKG